MIEKPSDYLEEAKEYVRHEATWTKCYEALDKDGNQVPVDSDEACIFCMWGAMKVVEPLAGDPGVVFTARTALQTACLENNLVAEQPYVTITEFNDDPIREHREVIKAFDRAIYLADVWEEKAADACRWEIMKKKSGRYEG